VPDIPFFYSSVLLTLKTYKLSKHYIYENISPPPELYAPIH